MLRMMIAGLQMTASPDHWAMAKPQRDLHAVYPCLTDREDSEIFVCGRRDDDRYRLKPLPQRFEEKGGLPVAEKSIGGGTVGITTQQVMIGNVPSNRVMLSLKLPF